VANAIGGMAPGGGFTCIGCGIDDGVENSYTNRREGASQVMIVLTDGFNNLPEGTSAQHLQGALAAAAFHGLTLFAIGIGDASINEINQIATDIPGVQTAFTVNDFTQLSTILNAIVLGAGLGNVTKVHIVLPDETEVLAPIGADRQFAAPNWTVLPGENLFTANIPNPYVEETAFLHLVGVYACRSSCGDLTGDESVNLRDAAAFMVCFGGRSWDSAVCGCADLQGDTRIDLLDFAAFRSNLDSPSENSPPNCPSR